MSTLEVTVAGEVYIDLVFSGFPSWPKPGEEVIASQFRREVGGGAAITAVGLAKLGTRVAILGAVGREDGAWVAERLASFGVDTSHLHFVENEPTGLTVAVSSPEDRAFFTYPGANRGLPELLREAPFASPHVHLAFSPDWDAIQELLARWRAHGCSTSIDIGWDAADPRGLSALHEVDLFFPNELEAERITGEREPGAMLRAFRTAGFRGVALKMGEKGAALLWQGAIFRADAPKVTPLDTTGAGDCFDAGFLHAWLKGCDPIEWLRAGSFCGAMSTRAMGGVAGFPTMEEFECRSK